MPFPLLTGADGDFLFGADGDELLGADDEADTFYGGVGHFKLELARTKQVARITRNAPPPVDRRTKPKFEPIRL